MMNISKSPSYWVAPSYQRKLVDPNWNYDVLPTVGECWMIRTTEHQNPPVIAFCLNIVSGTLETMCTDNSGMRTTKKEHAIQYNFAAAYVDKRKQLYIKKQDKEQFHNSIIRNRVLQGKGLLTPLNGVDCCVFRMLVFSESYLKTQISKKMNIRLNPQIVEIWKILYMKYKFISGREWEIDNTWRTPSGVFSPRSIPISFTPDKGVFKL